MSETSDREPEPPHPEEVSTSVSTSGVDVEKVASLHGGDAVAVYLTLYSTREERCTVRMTDTIPEPLRQNEVEFHPRYDPVNWTQGDAAVMYATTLQPDQSRTTVYGVTIDSPSQTELFEVEPTVEVIANERPPEPEQADELVESAEGDAFDFSHVDHADEGDEGGLIDDTGDASRSGQPDSAVAELATDLDDGSVVERFVEELEQRDLSDRERRTIRESLDLESNETLESRLTALGEAVDDLQTTVEREVRWRSKLREQLRRDPDALDGADEAAGGSRPHES